MSIHPSLGATDKSKKQKSVLKNNQSLRLFPYDDLSIFHKKHNHYYLHQQIASSNKASPLSTGPL